MTTSFDPTNGLIVIGAEIWGPAGSAILRLALDTGATRTLVNPALLTALGYDTALSHTRIEITTGSGVEYAALVEIQSVYALDQTVLRFPVLAHTCLQLWYRWPSWFGLCEMWEINHRSPAIHHRLSTMLIPAN